MHACMQVLVATSLEVLKQAPSATRTASTWQATLEALQGAVRVAPDSTLPHILSAIDHLFLSAAPSMLQQLQPGDPYATLLSTAPHLTPSLLRSIDHVLLSAASTHTSDDRMHAMLSHLSPFLLQCMASDRSLSDATCMAVERVAERRPAAHDACAACILASLAITPSPHNAMLSQPSAPAARSHCISW